VGAAEVRLAHTAALSAFELAAIRALFDVSFSTPVTESDVEHCLGGMHATVWVEGRLAGHGSIVQRRLLHGGRALRTGYLEGVAVHPGHRRQGHGHALMAALEQVVRGGYELGALAASAAGVPLYAARGWERWSGPTSVLAPDGLRRTPDDDGAIFFLPVTAWLDPAGDLVCDWRDGDVW
jgi:aminoglycoside 2'-N-acetyltransferase I